jgi:hypothetical protein
MPRVTRKSLLCVQLYLPTWGEARAFALPLSCQALAYGINLVDPASSHMLVSKIKPCMSMYKLLYGETANGSLKQL